MEQPRNSSNNGLVLLKSAINSTQVQDRLAQCVKENKGVFASSILDLYTGDKSLQACNPNAIITECLKAAALNLPINKALGCAYVVVYNNNVKTTDPQTGKEVWIKVPTPTFIPGYRGYIQLALRSGQYRTINADVVYEGELGHIDKLSGFIDLSGRATSDKIIGYFAHFELLNGFQKTLYMSLENMAAYALRYAPSLPKGTKKEDLIKKANDGIVSKQVGWMGNFNDMGIKTCIRRLIGKYGYMSIEMQNAFIADTEADMAMTQRQEVVENTKTIEIDMVKHEDINLPGIAEPIETAEVSSMENNDKKASLLKEEEQPGY